MKTTSTQKNYNQLILIHYLKIQLINLYLQPEKIALFLIEKTSFRDC
jgi:hypothetical protein